MLPQKYCTSLGMILLLPVTVIAIVPTIFPGTAITTTHLPLIIFRAMEIAAMITLERVRITFPVVIMQTRIIIIIIILLTIFQDHEKTSSLFTFRYIRLNER